MSEKATGLDLLRVKFDDRHISKLPKETKKQSEDCKNNVVRKIKCQVCGGFHHPDAVHLDYVGHAALTDRLLDADLEWTWEPLAFDEQGLPRFDKSGGLWIKLTVCGMTRLGYGNAEGKSFMDVGSREKEVIGDALRNAAMRFGAALDLWHKGDLHADEEPEPKKAPSGSAKEVMQDAFNSLTPGEQEAMRTRANAMSEIYYAKGVNDAVDYYEDLKLDSDSNLAFWYLVDAPLRKTIKDERARRRQNAG